MVSVIIHFGHKSKDQPTPAEMEHSQKYTTQGDGFKFGKSVDMEDGSVILA